MISDLVGYLGGIFIMISFVPQVIKSYKTKSVADLSIWMIIATFVGTLFWIIYGFLIGSRQASNHNEHYIYLYCFLPNISENQL